MENEEFRNIKLNGGVVVEKYKISNFGKILNTHNGKFLRTTTQNTTGYKVVCLNIDGKGKFCYVHRLLANVFIQNPNNLPFIDHKNRARGDNRLENLRWCTSSENQTNRTVNRTKNKEILYKGVYPSGKKYAVIIKKFYAGTYETQEDAALVYNSLAFEYYGEFAVLNDV